MRRLMGAAAAFFSAAGLCAAAPPRTAEAAKPSPGVVVEAVDAESPPARAGVREGDVLVGWERAANPPANPLPAHGTFSTPMDVEDVCIDEVDRGKLSLFVLRDGKRLSLETPLGFWDAFDLVFRKPQIQLRPPLDRRDLDAYLEGQRLSQSKDGEPGLAAWRSLAEDWSRDGASPRSVWMWLKLGRGYARVRRFPEAQEAFQAALCGSEELGLDAATMTILNVRGKLFIRQGRSDRADEAWSEVVRISARKGRPSLWAARAQAERGNIQWRGGAPMEGHQLFRESVAICEKAAPGGLYHSAYLTNRGACALDLGDLEGAERDDRAALRMMERLDQRDEADAMLINLGDVLVERGDLAGGEALYQESLALAVRKSPGSNAEAIAAASLGEVALLRGDPAAAEAFFRRTLAIEEKINTRSDYHAMSLDRLGAAALARGDVAAADAFYRQSLEIIEKLQPGSLKVAAPLDGLGRLALRRDDPTAAAAYFERALAIREKVAPGGMDASGTLNGLGDAAAATGELDRAGEYYQKSLAVLERFSSDSILYAETLHDLGALSRRSGHLKEAEGYFGRAIDALESQKKKLGGTEEDRSLFEAGHQDYYRDYVEVLIELGKKDDAFRTLERSRARALLVLLAERDLVFSGDVPPELERESKLADAAYDRVQAELKELGTADKAKEEELRGRMRELRRQREQLAERLRQASPRYGALRHPRPLDLPGARAVLDPGTLLLSFSVGREKTYLFAVGAGPKQSNLSVFTLPIGEKTLRDSVKAFRKLIEWGEPSAELTARARSLYDTLLRPAEARIAGCDRLLILSDGPLLTLPWAALARSSGGRPEYLVEWKPVHTGVSATVFAELKKERRRPASPSIDVAAFGDPLYPKLPERKVAVKRGEDGPPTAENSTDEEVEEEVSLDDAQLKSVVRGGFRFDPLPASRMEVEQIVRLYSPRAEAFLGADATEEKAKTIGKDVPLIHFACHAVVNERFPLDSALAFSIPDHPREGQDNGLLQAWEIFEKVRIDADLVTLSACESGLGKEMGGEGLIGLTRAFQYAGARSVLASLWKVEDKATGELMKRFYEYLKAGKTKDEALRLAQIDLIHSPALAQPVSWAAFQISGDWK